jgi:RNA methyltransferase, TrmH family
MPPAAADRERTPIERFRRARRDPTRAVLEGFHAIKHAIRFGAALEQVCAVDLNALRALTSSLAPDIEPALRELVQPVPPWVFAELAPYPPETGMIAIARRPQADVATVLQEPGAAPVVLLERPAHLGNLGAVVRAAAAAGAAAVLTTGPQDPWHPAALRGSAGLHFALPVGRVRRPPADRPLVAFDPAGEPLGPLPDDAVLAFGSERHGLSDELLARAELRVAIPMRAGVSSLNLATAAAVALYSARSGFSQRSIVQTGRIPTDS